MNKPKYLYKSEGSFHVYEFVSEGTKGSIKKMVQFTKTGTEHVYNLAFGDYDEKTNAINDLSVTNNGDSLKVLATVASTVYAFIDKHPNVWVLATGSTNVRTRLYRMGITNNLVDIKEDFEVYGFTQEGLWEEFVVGEDYEAFLITKKTKHAMTIEQLNASKVPVIVIDKRLDQFREVVLFPKKLEKANEILSKVGLPNSPNRTK